MIVLTWDSQLEERLCALLNVDIFLQQEGVLLWDLQRAEELTPRFGHSKDSRQGRDAGKAADALGIPVTTEGNKIDPNAIKLSHNASMDAAFTLEMLLALCFLTPEQSNLFRSGHNLPELPRRFSSYTVAQNHPSKLCAPKPSKQAAVVAGRTPVAAPASALYGGAAGGGKGKEVVSTQSDTTMEAKLDPPFPLRFPPNLHDFAKLAPPSWLTGDPGLLNIPSAVATKWVMSCYIAQYNDFAELSVILVH
ncbi:hypothetical protein ColTof4_08558 [Colletotrichum tofieldiae]|nr:hypothetical protein ColTof4_08558 [Colletotrichum tofieldiae]GKT87165.1 hypothetical protein Ct61P_05015 [Colletotrichum tofieldiae]